ncbi:MAG: hypothetical protein ACPGOV_11735 [Magnetovibrionaceae bacterium]
MTKRTKATTVFEVPLATGKPAHVLARSGKAAQTIARQHGLPVDQVKRATMTTLDPDLVVGLITSQGA